MQGMGDGHESTAPPWQRSTRFLQSRPGDFDDGAREELWHDPSVAPPEPARLHRQAECPLEPRALQRRRCLRDCTRVKIESRADADEHGRQPAAVLVAPALLSGAT